MLRYFKATTFMWLFLFFSQSLTVKTQPSQCCLLLDQIHRYTRYKNAVEKTCSPHTCVELGLVKRFVQETNSVIKNHSHHISMHGADLRLPTITDADEQRQMLVWAFIGRWIADDADINTAHADLLEYNNALNTIHFQKQACEFQKPFYVVMLTCCLLIIISYTILGSTIGSSFTEIHDKEKEGTTYSLISKRETRVFDFN